MRGGINMAEVAKLNDWIYDLNISDYDKIEGMRLLNRVLCDLLTKEAN